MSSSWMLSGSRPRSTALACRCRSRRSAQCPSSSQASWPMRPGWRDQRRQMRCGPGQSGSPGRAGRGWLRGGAGRYAMPERVSTEPWIGVAPTVSWPPGQAGWLGRDAEGCGSRSFVTTLRSCQSISVAGYRQKLSIPAPLSRSPGAIRVRLMHLIPPLVGSSSR